ncbi:MAG: hypothetical protein WC526_00235 [Patescibacteria group bacterium]
MPKKIAKKMVIFIIPLLFMFAVPALAQYGLGQTASKAGYQQSDVYTFVGQGINLFLALLAIVFLGIMFYTGFRWMTARGNEEYAKKAKNALEAGIIGLIIILAAYAISNFVISRLAVK